MENRCLYCNSVIPEGRQICPQCEYKLRERRKEVSNNDIILSKIIFIACCLVVAITLFHMRG